MSANESGFFTKQVAYASEAELVQGLLADEPLAWKTFEERYTHVIDRCIGKVLRKFKRLASDEDIAEVRSNVHVELLSADRSKLRSWRAERGARFSSWIGMIAIHAAHDYLRTARREPQKEEVTAAFELVSEGPDPYQLAATSESLSRTRKFIETLSSKDQEFALLYFTEGLEPEEVARRMGISINTVYSKRHKIKERLVVALAGANRRAA